MLGFFGVSWCRWAFWTKENAFMTTCRFTVYKAQLLSSLVKCALGWFLLLHEFQRDKSCYSFKSAILGRLINFTEQPGVFRWVWLKSGLSAVAVSRARSVLIRSEESDHGWKQVFLQIIFFVTLLYFQYKNDWLSLDDFRHWQPGRVIQGSHYMTFFIMSMKPISP